MCKTALYDCMIVDRRVGREVAGIGGERRFERRVGKEKGGVGRRMYRHVRRSWRGEGESWGGEGES